MVHYRIVKVSVRFAVYSGASYDTVIGLVAVTVFFSFFFSQGFGVLAECISTCSMTLFRHAMSMLLKLMTYGLEG